VHGYSLLKNLVHKIATELKRLKSNGNYMYQLLNDQTSPFCNFFRFYMILAVNSDYFPEQC